MRKTLWRLCPWHRAEDVVLPINEDKREAVEKEIEDLRHGRVRLSWIEARIRLQRQKEPPHHGLAE